MTLDVGDLRSLRDKARNYCYGKSTSPCNWLYRNQSESYFENILRNNRGLMEVVTKDNSGDPGSPINGKLKGLFFMARNENGQPQGILHSVLVVCKYHLKFYWTSTQIFTLPTSTACEARPIT
jgi:hypothetical protein